MAKHSITGLTRTRESSSLYSKPFKCESELIFEPNLLTTLALLIRARKVDAKVAQEIQQTLTTGIAINLHNRIQLCMARNVKRTTTATLKNAEVANRKNKSADIKARLNAKMEWHRESQALSKQLKEELAATQGKSVKAKQLVAPFEEGDSCGRVKRARTGMARSSGVFTRLASFWFVLISVIYKS